MNWLFSAPPALMLLFHIAALIFVMSQRSDGSAAKTLVITAITMFLLSNVTGLVARVLVVRVVEVSDVPFYFGILSWCSTLVSIAAFSLLIGAVYAGRSRTETEHRLFASEQTDKHNPYLPPSN